MAGAGWEERAAAGRTAGASDESQGVRRGDIYILLQKNQFLKFKICRHIKIYSIMNLMILI